MFRMECVRFKSEIGTESRKIDLSDTKPMKIREKRFISTQYIPNATYEQYEHKSSNMKRIHVLDQF